MSTQNTRRTRIETERRLTRYDLFLVLLPLPLLFGASWAAMTSIPLSAGIGLSGLPTLALLLYGLFIGGPTASLPAHPSDATAGELNTRDES